MAWRVWSRFPSKCHNYLETSGTTLTAMRRVPSLHKCSNVHTSPTHLCKQIEPNHTANKPSNTRQILRSKPSSSRYSYTSKESRRPPGIIHSKHSSRCSASHTSSASSLPSPPVSLPAATQHRNGCWLPGTSLLSLATNSLVPNFTTPPPSAKMSLSSAMVSGTALSLMIAQSAFLCSLFDTVCSASRGPPLAVADAGLVGLAASFAPFAPTSDFSGSGCAVRAWVSSFLCRGVDANTRRDESRSSKVGDCRGRKARPVLREHDTKPGRKSSRLVNMLLGSRGYQYPRSVFDRAFDETCRQAIVRPAVCRYISLLEEEEKRMSSVNLNGCP
jgi:hypothetical protein